MPQLHTAPTPTASRRVPLPCLILTLLGVLCAAGLKPHRAQASADPPGLYDARVMGMGGAGAASARGGAAAFHNPALLGQIEKMVVTVSAATLLGQQNSPFIDDLNGEVTNQRDSTASLVPLGLLGVGYRVHPRVAIGLAAYIVTGFGGAYEQPFADSGVVDFFGTEDWEFGVVVGELSVPAAIVIHDNLTLGIQPKAMFVAQTIKVLNGETFQFEETSLSGRGMVGVNVGMHYALDDWLNLGLVYVSRVQTELTGTVKSEGGSRDVIDNFVRPHGFRIGTALTLLGGDLQVAADAAYQLFADSNAEAPTYWQDTYGACLGLEYWIHERIPVRLGSALGRSPTRDDRPSAFSLPPGFTNTVHAGVGLQLEHWRLDGAGYYSVASAIVEPGSTKDPAMHPHGAYDLAGIFAGASLSYVH